MSAYQHSDAFVVRSIRDERILVPIMGSMEALDSLFSLNDTAGLIWDLAGDGLDAPAIAKRVAAEYEVPEDKAQADTAKILDELLTIGALEKS